MCGRDSARGQAELRMGDLDWSCGETAEIESENFLKDDENRDNLVFENNCSIYLT